jgi:hypothetical protein
MFLSVHGVTLRWSLGDTHFTLVVLMRVTDTRPILLWPPPA